MRNFLLLILEKYKITIIHLLIKFIELFLQGLVLVYLINIELCLHLFEMFIDSIYVEFSLNFKP